MLAILSDIHGNYPALQAVLEDMRKYPITDIICLGDICGYYAMVNECIDCLRSHNIVSLKGNHDYYLLGELQCERSKTVTKCIEFQKKVITKGNLDWLKTLHCQRETPIYAAVHGGWKDPIDEYILGDFDFTYVKRQYPSLHVFLSGHTHIPTIQTKDKDIYCNPGAVGQPRDYDARASYAIYDGQKMEIHRVAYNIDEICQVMKDKGFDAYTYENLYHGVKIGG